MTGCTARSLKEPLADAPRVALFDEVQFNSPKRARVMDMDLGLVLGLE